VLISSSPHFSSDSVGGFLGFTCTTHPAVRPASCVSHWPPFPRLLQARIIVFEQKVADLEEECARLSHRAGVNVTFKQVRVVLFPSTTGYSKIKH
jgi:hypothetical protein